MTLEVLEKANELKKEIEIIEGLEQDLNWSDTIEIRGHKYKLDGKILMEFCRLVVQRKKELQKEFDELK